jgi:tricarballylate dehydrogenase
MSKQVIVVGSGNAAMCAGIAALEGGARVLMLEKADEALAGGNTKYTAGAMRFAYDGADDLLPLLKDPDDPRLKVTDFGGYTREKFGADLLAFNGGRDLSVEQERLIGSSLEAMQWLGRHGVKFEPIYSRQSFEKDGRHVFWGGLTLAAENEGVGLFDMELAVFIKLGGSIRYSSEVTGLITHGDRVTGVTVGDEAVNADAVILACGGFEASAKLRADLMGGNWEKAKVRGTPHNTGDGLVMAHGLGAEKYGLYASSHATPMDLHMPDFANLDLPAGERKNYRKICYFLGVMLNANGNRFVDEGKNFRNYTYAQFGKSVLDQPGHFAWQVFDAKVDDLLYAEYRFHDAHFIEADTLDDLCAKMDGIDAQGAYATLNEYNDAVMVDVAFDPTSLDGKGTRGLSLAKSNWAQKIDTPPFKAYPVTGGITFTYGGLKVSDSGAVLRDDGTAIDGLFACGEIVGGVFFEGYPGGSGLTSGAVFGQLAGHHAALCVANT